MLLLTWKLRIPQGINHKCIPTRWKLLTVTTSTVSAKHQTLSHELKLYLFVGMEILVVIRKEGFCYYPVKHKMIVNKEKFCCLLTDMVTLVKYKKIIIHKKIVYLFAC